MRRILFFLLLALVGSAPVTAQTGKLTPAQSLKSMCVISALGDQFALQKVGMTVFGNELHHIGIEAWGIDDLVVAKATALFGKRFAVRRLSFRKDAFESIQGLGSGLFRDYEAEIKQVIRGISASQKCDHYLVVLKGGSKFGTTNQLVRGLGLVVASGPLFDSAHLFALSIVRIYEGQNLNLVRDKRGTIGQSTFMATISGPYREVDGSWWPKTAADHQRLKEATRSLVEQSLMVTLPQLLASD